MRILINGNNEIVGYATVGGLEGDFEIDDSVVPQDFAQNYKPKYYLYHDEKSSLIPIINLKHLNNPLHHHNL